MNKFKTAKEKRIDARQLEITKLKLEQDYVLALLFEAITVGNSFDENKYIVRLKEIHKELEEQVKGIEEEKLKPY